MSLSDDIIDLLRKELGLEAPSYDLAFEDALSASACEPPSRPMIITGDDWEAVAADQAGWVKKIMLALLANEWAPARLFYGDFASAEIITIWEEWQKRCLAVKLDLMKSDEQMKRAEKMVWTLVQEVIDLHRCGYWEDRAIDASMRCTERLLQIVADIKGIPDIANGLIQGIDLGRFAADPRQFKPTALSMCRDQAVGRIVVQQRDRLLARVAELEERLGERVPLEPDRSWVDWNALLQYSDRDA